MREIDENGLRLCDMQAKIFAGTLTATQCGSAVFIRRFMFSRFARRMDNESYLYETSTENDVYAEIEEEYGKTNYGKERYSYNELYWIGYIYRYWCYTYQMESKKVYKIISPRELKKLYFPYHSLDPNNAIERIVEAKGIQKEDLVIKGVRVLRKIREKHQ